MRPPVHFTRGHFLVSCARARVGAEIEIFMKDLIITRARAYTRDRDSSEGVVGRCQGARACVRVTRVDKFCGRDRPRLRAHVRQECDL